MNYGLKGIGTLSLVVLAGLIAENPDVTTLTFFEMILGAMLIACILSAIWTVDESYYNHDND